MDKYSLEKSWKGKFMEGTATILYEEEIRSGEKIEEIFSLVGGVDYEQLEFLKSKFGDWERVAIFIYHAFNKDMMKKLAEIWDKKIKVDGSKE